MFWIIHVKNLYAILLNEFYTHFQLYSAFSVDHHTIKSKCFAKGLLHDTRMNQTEPLKLSWISCSYNKVNYTPHRTANWLTWRSAFHLKAWQRIIDGACLWLKSISYGYVIKIKKLQTITHSSCNISRCVEKANAVLLKAQHFHKWNGHGECRLGNECIRVSDLLSVICHLTYKPSTG